MVLLVTVALLLLLLLASVAGTDTRDGRDWQPQRLGGPLSTRVSRSRRARPDRVGARRVADVPKRLAAMARRVSLRPRGRAGVERAHRPVGAVGADCAPS